MGIKIKADYSKNRIEELNILNYGTCGHAHKVPALITKIQPTHKHNNKSIGHTKVHTALLDST